MNYEKELIEFKTPLLLAAATASGSNNPQAASQNKVEQESDCPYTKLDDTADNFESQEAGDEETDDTRFMKGVNNGAGIEGFGGGGEYTIAGGSPKH